MHGNEGCYEHVVTWQDEFVPTERFLCNVVYSVLPNIILNL
jgi:hypothetical protein